MGSDARTKIIEAALDQFATLGFEGASTRKIAENAGVNQGLITYYFEGGKEQLWKEAVDSIFSRLTLSVAERFQQLAEVDEPTRFRLLIRHFIRFAAAHPQLPLMMARDGGTDGPRSRWLHDTYSRPLYQTMCAVAEKSRAANGPATEISPSHVFFVLIGAGTYPFAMSTEYRHLTGEDPFSKKATEAWASTVETLLLGPEPVKPPARGRRAR